MAKEPAKKVAPRPTTRSKEEIYGWKSKDDDDKVSKETLQNIKDMYER